MEIVVLLVVVSVAVGVAVAMRQSRSYSGEETPPAAPPREARPAPRTKEATSPSPRGGGAPVVTQRTSERRPPASQPLAGPRADGWIRTTRPWEELEAAVREHVGLAIPKAPVDVEVVVSEHPLGFRVLTVHPRRSHGIGTSSHEDVVAMGLSGLRVGL